MTRRPRRKSAEDKLDPTKITFSEAYLLEAAATWPSWRDRRAFWTRPDIPKQHRPVGEPDPRILLGPDPPTAAEYQERRDAWLAARVEWLKEQAEAGQK